MPGCAAVGCNNRSEKGYTMKCFPRNTKLRKIWTDRVSRADWEPSNNSFLCHVHFEADQWTITQSGRFKLKKSAVPSLFAITSTRKSPKKRAKFTNNEEEDLYIIEYLDDSKNRVLSPTSRNTAYNRYTTSNISTTIGQPVYMCSSYSTSTQIVMQNRKRHETIIVSDENSERNEKPKDTNGIVKNRKDTKTNDSSESIVKKEMKSQINSDRDLDDIEEKLRYICDGESVFKENITMEREKTRTNEKENSKSISQKCNDDVKCSPKLTTTRNNGNSLKDHESNGIRDSLNGEKRSKFEIIKDPERTVAKANNSTNGVINPQENVEKTCRNVNTTRRSTFTIKLTGNEEDVTEIVEGLGTEPILKYKSSSELSNRNGNFVTSVISVTDTFLVKSKQEEEDTKPKIEVRESTSNDIENKKSTRINGNQEKFEDRTKLSVESPEDDEDSMNCERLRKKIKFQEDVIRKLTDQLTDSKVTTSAMNHMHTRSQSKKRKISPNPCNGECQNDSKDTMLVDLTSKVNESNATIKGLNKILREEEQNAKKLQLMLRQRDNRIKELNWKLDKASKYIERAEKNANAYRKKMLSMQNLLTRKNRVEKESTIVTTTNLRNVQSTFSPETTNSSDVGPSVRHEDEDRNTSNESVVYRTVQDIFDESNHCDDNDPIIIDNAEDFMRQFAGSL